MGISGNTANVDGIRLEQSVVFGRLFRLLRLQVLGEAFPIKYGQLVQYPVPVPVTLRPFFDYIRSRYNPSDSPGGTGLRPPSPQSH